MKIKQSDALLAAAKRLLTALNNLERVGKGAAHIDVMRLATELTHAHDALKAVVKECEENP